MQHRNLAAFARWFLAQPLRSWRPPHIQVAHYVLASGAIVYGVVIHRDPPYQVEMFVSAGTGSEATFPEHRHPDVDSIECYLMGEIYFTIAGKRMAPDEFINRIDPDGAHALTGVLQRVRSKDWHGAELGPMGGCFLSLQRWTDGIEPTSVTANWIGPPHISASR